jgi:hypothetical protein
MVTRNSLGAGVRDVLGGGAGAAGAKKAGVSADVTAASFRKAAASAGPRTKRQQKPEAATRVRRPTMNSSAVEAGNLERITPWT